MTPLLIVQIELALLLLFVLTEKGQVLRYLDFIHKDLRKIKKILRYGVRVFPLATGIVFLNSKGEKVTQMNIQDSGQILSLAFAGVDAAGNPAPLDAASVPVFTLDDTSEGSIDASGVFTPSGKLGTVNLSVSIPAVNAQPALAGSLAVSVVAGAAIQLTLSGTVSAAPVAPAS